ncbi:hypothetical protein DPMN_014081 [Dreissena polymorpha]|uniref:Uncharacterized protein n=1 Tax=Dreissena polymorpha TaxID=45954 RepID=A0A9D4NA71_DREPO|nr:hypothetical protein DPMN_014081 [Dreissena polymorpha]
MVPEDCDPSKLKINGAVQVETLGRNHTREALLQRCLTTMTTVKMNIYSAMSTCTALTVGWQHNVSLQEKQKSLSFMDKVRLMRQVRPSMPMSPTDLKAWKEALSSIFHVNLRTSNDSRIPMGCICRWLIWNREFGQSWKKSRVVQ